MIKKKIALIVLCLTACSVESKPKIIQGTVSIAPAYANKGAPSDTLYILAYKVSKKEGPESAPESHPAYLKEPPLVIKKISPVLFPVKFELSEKDILFPENKLSDEVNLIARLSRSGSPVAKKGDLEGVYKKNPTKVGEKNAEILINQEAAEK